MAVVDMAYLEAGAADNARLSPAGVLTVFMECMYVSVFKPCCTSSRHACRIQSCALAAH